VNLEDKAELVHFDAQKLVVFHRWPLAPCEEPSGLAADWKTRRLFVGCGNKLMAVIDADSGKIVATVPIGDGVDANAFDPATNLAFASTGDGNLTVVHEDSPDKYSLAQDLVTHAGKTFGYDPKTRRLYVPGNENGALQLLVYDSK